MGEGCEEHPQREGRRAMSEVMALAVLSGWTHPSYGTGHFLIDLYIREVAENPAFKLPFSYWLEFEAGKLLAEDAGEFQHLLTMESGERIQQGNASGARAATFGWHDDVAAVAVNIGAAVVRLASAVAISRCEDCEAGLLESAMKRFSEQIHQAVGGACADLQQARLGSLPGERGGER